MPVLGSDRPKRGQDTPKKAIKSYKVPKTCICENLTKPHTFTVFRVQGRPRQPRKAQEGSQEALDELQNLEKKGSENGPYIFTNLWITFEAILGSILWFRSTQKGSQKWDQFRNPLPRAKWTSNVVTCCWIYILKKKGRDSEFIVRLMNSTLATITFRNYMGLSGAILGFWIFWSHQM